MASGDLPLTDRLLRSWVRCRRRAWLDRHGPPERRLWSAHRALALQDQLRCFQSLLPQRPGHGEEACAAGDPGVVGLRLRGTGPGGSLLEAHPSLLQRVEGDSRWGAHGYRPVLARQGRRLTREHRLLMALWARLLEGHQRAPVSHGLVLARANPWGEPERERLAIGATLHRQLEDSLLRLAQDLRRPEAPPLVSDRKKCTLCSWRGLCDQTAASEGHLSEVSGIGGKRRELLLEAGITTLRELAEADPLTLADVLEVHGDQHREVAAQLVAQARVQASGIPVRLAHRDALPELAAAPGVLVYDIESDPDARDDFLHGFLRLEPGANGRWPDPVDGQGSYHPLLALQEHGESLLWERLRRLLGRYPGWPVLHYGETEAIGLLRLAQRQGAADGEIEALRSRLIDVHKRLRSQWLLPVNSYGLKAVAAWLGFRWSQQGVDGARCLLWWRLWRQGRHDTGARRRSSGEHLRRIFRYNHDDGLATWAVARWLLDQAAPAMPTGGGMKSSATESRSSATEAPSPERSTGSSRA